MAEERRSRHRPPRFTITRLLDKLEGAGLILRERALPDRRQVICYVTAEGKKLLGKLDPIVDAADEEASSALDARDLRQLIAMLATLRAANAKRGAPRTMVSREQQALRAARGNAPAA